MGKQNEKLQAAWEKLPQVLKETVSPADFQIGWMAAIQSLGEEDTDAEAEIAEQAKLLRGPIPDNGLRFRPLDFADYVLGFLEADVRKIPVQGLRDALHNAAIMLECGQDGIAGVRERWGTKLPVLEEELGKDPRFMDKEGR